MDNCDRDNRNGLNRRGFIKAGAGLTAGLMLPAFMDIARAGSPDHPPLGNYPDGVSGDTAFVGMTVPQTGAYSAQGDALFKGYQLAVEHLNKGGGLVDRISSLTGRGVLKKEVIYEVGDSETKANSAIQVLTRMIREKKAIMITGSVSSSVAVAAEQLAQREKVVYFAGESTSDETTGASRKRYGFRSQVSAYMLAKSLAPILADELGNDRKAAYLVPDYTYGHTMFASNSKFTEAQGWTTVGKQVYPTGMTDFSSHLLNIASSGADVFVNIAYGADSVNSIRQAQQFGILDDMTLVCPLIADFVEESVGAKTMQGVYGAVDFWWTMADEDEMANIFVDTFQTKFGRKPSWGSELAYTQMMLWADSVERAGSYYPPAVIKALESGHKLSLPIGEAYYRDCDHQLVRKVPIVKGKKPSDMKNSEDYFEIVDYLSGEDAIPGCNEFPGKLGSYT